MSAHDVLAGHIPEIDVGTPSDEFRLRRYAQEWETVIVRFHAFEDLEPDPDGYAASPDFSCLGHNWSLHLISDGADINLGVDHRSDEDITIQLSFCCIDDEGCRQNEFMFNKDKEFASLGNDDGFASWIADEFAKRSEIIKLLVGGSLVVEVRMREVDADMSPKPFIPVNPLPRSTLSKFMDEESSDIVFEVSSRGESSKTTSKRRRTKTSSIFHAHRFIVQNWKGAVGELSKSSGEDSTPIAVSDVTPEVFRHLLYYSYGGKISAEDLKANAKDIIDAADKYGVVGLKLEAEATLVITTKFTMENVMDNLLYSDAKNCALLKEAVMDFLVDNANEAIKKLSFGNFPGHLVKDLLAVVAMGKKDNNNSADPGELSKARVSTLRKMLHEKGLNTDGSREMMIARLEENPASSGEALLQLYRDILSPG